MEKLAKEYKRTHAGKVLAVTDYCFTFETLPTKDGKTQKYVVMESYFFKPKNTWQKY